MDQGHAQHSIDKQSPEDPVGYMPGFTTPAEESAKKQKIGEQPIVQAEKLLSQPIEIPRNPWALMVRSVAIVFTTDFSIALLLLALWWLYGGISRVLLILIAVALVAKAIVLSMWIWSMTARWVPDSYLITERQLIKKTGIATKDEKHFELANIRHVRVVQDFIGRQLDYGNVELLIATAGLNETLRLTDLKDPKHFEAVFSEYLG